MHKELTLHTQTLTFSPRARRNRSVFRGSARTACALLTPSQRKDPPVLWEITEVRTS